MAALLSFSAYEDDVVIERGNDKQFSALDSPEPAALTAERLKPTILGQPNIPEDVEFAMSDYHSFIPAYLRVEVDSDSITSLMITILHKNIDWEKQDDGYVANFNLRISFQNKSTLKLKEFFTGFKKEISQDKIENGTLVVFPVHLRHWDGEKSTFTFGELLEQLEPGEYVVNIYLQHSRTKKYNAWREEITISQ